MPNKKSNFIPIQEIIDTLPIGIIYLDNNRITRYLNNIAKELLTKLKIDLINLDFLESPLVTKSGMKDVFATMFTTPYFPDPISFSYFLTEDNAIDLDISIAPLLTEPEHSKKQDWIVILRDKTVSNKQREIIRSLYTAIDAAANYILITDSSGVFIYVNYAFLRDTGYTMSDLVDKTPRILKSPLHEDGFYECLWKTINSKKVWRGEFANLKKNGELFYVNATISPVVNSDGEIISYVGVQENITEKKALTEEVQRKQEIYQKLFERTYAGMSIHEMVFDKAGKPVDYRFLKVNDQFTVFTGLKREDVEGRLISEVLPESFKDSANWLERYARIVKTGQPDIAFNLEAEALNRNFNVFSFKVGANQFCSSFVDNSELKNLQERDRAFEFLKSEFMAIATHEMRTPLAIALGYLGLLSENLERYDEDSVTWIKRSHEKLLEMRDLINSSLDLIELHVNPVGLRDKFKPINLSYLTVYIIEKYRDIAKSKKIVIVPQISDLTIIIDGHRQLVERAIEAIIINAIKFSEQNDVIKISVTRIKNNGHCRIDVEDSGIGITATGLSIIFLRFRQVEHATVREHGGLGLGLPLARDILRLHDGEVEVTSTFGVGSKFSLIFPMTNNSEGT